MISSRLFACKATTPSRHTLLAVQLECQSTLGAVFVIVLANQLQLALLEVAVQLVPEDRLNALYSCKWDCIRSFTQQQASNLGTDLWHAP